MSLTKNEDTDDLITEGLTTLSLKVNKDTNRNGEKIMIKDLGFYYIFVDSESALESMLLKMMDAEFVNVDFEGIDLSRTGQLCLGQFHVSGSSTVYLVDFVKMDPFSLANGQLKTLLESQKVCKIFFDPRNDTDALFHQFQVQPVNAICLQVSEVAYRVHIRKLNARYIFGLKRVFEEYVHLHADAKYKLLEIKENGNQLFNPERGGSYEVFKERPVAKELLEYSAVDVFYFDELRAKLFDPLSPRFQSLVKSFSSQRLLEHRNPNFKAKGPHKALAPQF